MGFALSVLILMTFNMRHFGVVLMASSKFLVNIPVRASVEQVQQDCRALAAEITDERVSGGSNGICSHLLASRHQTGSTMSKFADQVMNAKSLVERIVVLSLFLFEPLGYR